MHLNEIINKSLNTIFRVLFVLFVFILFHHMSAYWYIILSTISAHIMSFIAYIKCTDNSTAVLYYHTYMNVACEWYYVACASVIIIYILKLMKIKWRMLFHRYVPIMHYLFIYDLAIFYILPMTYPTHNHVTRCMYHVYQFLF